jgi:ribosomal protein S18 acetylase RimI-like enzyme
MIDQSFPALRYILSPSNLIPGLTFRPTRLKDLPLLRENCYPDTGWREFEDHYRYLLKWQEDGRCCTLVAEIDLLIGGLKAGSDIIGGGQLIYQGETAEIAELSVRADYRNQGVGTAMIHILTQIARERKTSILEIGVDLNNEAALRLYRRLGFGEERTMWLPNAQEAVFLKKVLRTRP